jgi:hypothetical protein
MDPTEMAAAVFDQVRAYVARGITPLIERIKALEERPIPKDGEPGKDVDPELVDKALNEKVCAKLDPLLAELPGTIDQRVKEAVAAIPRPRDGEDGESVTPEDLHPIMMLELSKWALDFERRAADVLQQAVSRIPSPPAPRDALQLEDFDLALEDDGRTVTLSLKRADAQVSKSITLPTVLDAGFYREDKTYSKGDGVTFGGSFWIAQKATDSKPETGNDDWRLAVKKGRDLR